ncbi:glycosyltransferase family 9 protein [Photorhabdus sp. RM71S]|uniref:glycosyltransferase family 9 protein n=1 Tax=Photorhabdus sp. RM71S TaxID=3342824 RepID=UPI0036DD5D67
MAFRDPKMFRNYFPNVRFIISTLRHDRSNAEKLSAMIRDQAQIVECQSLHSFLSLLNSTDLIIVSDGGICHLAAALNKKLQAVGKVIYTYSCECAVTC